MGAPQVLTSDSEPSRIPVVQGCPTCGEPWGALPAVPVSSLRDDRIRRCGRCGTRATCDRSPQRILSTCEVCGLPFLHGLDGSPEPRRCPGCRAETAVTEPPEPQVVHAMETEIRAALQDEWRFVTSEALRRYLDEIVHQVAARVEGAPHGCRVVLIDEPAQRVVALPSGLILMSVGMLRFLEDEAELVFVLAREIVHIASGDTAARVVRASLGVLAHDESGRPDTAWSGAMLDIARLGHGRHKEIEADAVALRAMLALRYEPGSALNMLRRLKRTVEMGDRNAADIAVAYPPPGYRGRKLEKVLFGRIGRAPVQRVNREVFRRVAGFDALRNLEPTEIGTRTDPAATPGAERRLGKLRVFLGAVAVAALAIVLWLLLR